MDELMEKVTNEIYRSDLISAMNNMNEMKVDPSEYVLITDKWRAEWQKAVQVPDTEIKLPKVLFRLRNVNYTVDDKKANATEITNYNNYIASQEMLYDLDQLDINWLSTMKKAGKKCADLSENLLQNVISFMECQVMEKQLMSLENVDKSKINNSVCDICLDPDTFEENEILFCDKCDCGVHQKCYDVKSIPRGSWMCDLCMANVAYAECVACRKTVRAPMRPVRIDLDTDNNNNNNTASMYYDQLNVKKNYQVKWVHSSCVLFLPELLNRNITSFSGGNIDDASNISFSEQYSVENRFVVFEPLTKKRNELKCEVCSQKYGCMQCCVKKCFNAFHIICAIKNKNLLSSEFMFKCKKHSGRFTSNNVDNEKKMNKLNDVNAVLRYSTKKNTHQLKSMVDLTSVQEKFDLLNAETIALVYNYWLMKRRYINGKPLVPLRNYLMSKEIFNSKEYSDKAWKALFKIRMDLERLRNLASLIIQREKLKLQLVEEAKSFHLKTAKK